MALGMEEEKVLDQIISGRGAWVSLHGLTKSVVDRLQELGFIVKWAMDGMGHEFRDGPYVTLTPFGAAWKRVTLVERVEGYPHWVDMRKAERRSRRHFPIRARRWSGMRLMAFPALVSIQDKNEMYLKNDDGETVYFFKGIPAKIDIRLDRGKRPRRRIY